MLCYVIVPYNYNVVDLERSALLRSYWPNKFLGILLVTGILHELISTS
jgi:hypothetical protein